MSGPGYKIGCLIDQANRQQPDCCSSLVYAWLKAMSVSEAAGAEWCRKASTEAPNSRFYADHIARNDLIQGTTRLETARRAHDIGAIMADVALRNVDVEMMTSARALLETVSQPLRELEDRQPEIAARQLMGFRLVHEWHNNIRKTLESCAMQLGVNKRFYILTVKAHRQAHAIGIVSTKAEGWFSPSGFIYYYDPNMRCVSKWQSREDFLLFARSIERDYVGLIGLQEFAVT